jgi:hypothetical protein
MALVAEPAANARRIRYDRIVDKRKYAAAMPVASCGDGSRPKNGSPNKVNSHDTARPMAALVLASTRDMARD